MQLIDVSRAHFYAPAVRDVYVQLPEGDPRHGEKGICGKLLRTMYGTLDAAEQWAIHYAKVLVAAGFRQGASNPCHFWHPERDIWVLVHGDDFLSTACLEDQDWLRDTLMKTYELKCERAGLAEGMPRELRVLGRILAFSEEGVSMEPDPQHLDVVASAL